MTHALHHMLVIALTLWAPCVTAAGELHRSVAARDGGTLEVDLSAGSVQIETHADPEVRVDASATGTGAGGASFELTTDGKDTKLRGTGGGWLSLFGGSRVRVRVRIPEVYSVDIRTGGGSVEIEDLGGWARVQTSGGSIELDGARGAVELRTSGGEVRVENISGDLKAETSGGPIRVSDVTGRVDVRTSGGSIQVYDVGGPVQAQTSGGSISVRFDGQPEGELDSSGGSIEASFDADAGLEVDARTSGGRVEIDEDFSFEGSIERSEAVGRLNGGGPLLRLKTSGGNVRIEAD